MRPKGKVHLIDFVAIVLSPVLIMLMVGSLVFFLIEVLQQGKFEGRLHYTFFFFVLGTVLIARISIEQGTKKAIFYGIGLGAACFIAMMAFVEYNTALFKVLGPIINLALMALVWWSAHKLTWDCTHLDEDAKASGRGVLAAVGLDTTKSTTEADDAKQYDPDRSSTATRKKKKTVDRFEEPEKIGLWQRYQQYRDWRKKKPHTPGVWVLYFALAAIPLYGLGQAMIPGDDAARRGNTFWQMATYIAAALGLLMTTTMLGLKRYLEARNASIPTPLTVAWLGLGGMLVVLFIGVAAILPRPHSETPLYSFDNGKKGKKASQNSQINDKSAGEGQGAKGQKTEAGDGKSNAKGGKEGGQGKGESKSGSGGQKQGNTSGNKQGEKSNGNSDKGKQGEKSNGPNNKQQDDQKAKQGEKQEGKQDDANKSEGDADKTDDKDKDEEGNDNKSETMQNLTKALESVSDVVKWIIWIAIALLVIVGGGYLFLKHASNFSEWAKGLLDWFIYRRHLQDSECRGTHGVQLRRTGVVGVGQCQPAHGERNPARVRATPRRRLPRPARQRNHAGRTGGADAVQPRPATEGCEGPTETVLGYPWRTGGGGGTVILASGFSCEPRTKHSERVRDLPGISIHRSLRCTPFASRKGRKQCPPANGSRSSSSNITKNWNCGIPCCGSAKPGRWSRSSARRPGSPIPASSATRQRPTWRPRMPT